MACPLTVGTPFPKYSGNLRPLGVLSSAVVLKAIYLKGTLVDPFALVIIILASPVPVDLNTIISVGSPFTLTRLFPTNNLPESSTI